MLRRVLQIRPFLWLGGLTLLIMLFGQALPLDYDDGGLGTAWFATYYSLTTPFRWASALIGSVLGTGVGFAHAALTLLLGSTTYLAADWLVTRVSRRYQGQK